jgi:hypothetical protein
MNVLPSRDPKAVAQRAVREAAGWAVFIGVLRVAFSIASLIHPKPDTSGLLYVASLFDCMLIFALAYGVYRMSRACTILLLVYFIADQLAKFFFVQEFAGAGMAGTVLVIGSLVLSVRAIFASFRYHAFTSVQTDAQTTIG